MRDETQRKARIWDILGCLKGEFGIYIALLLGVAWLSAPTVALAAQDAPPPFQLIIWGDAAPTDQTEPLLEALQERLMPYGYTVAVVARWPQFGYDWVLDSSDPALWRLHLPLEVAQPLRRLSPVLHSWPYAQEALDLPPTTAARADFLAAAMLYSVGICVDDQIALLPAAPLLRANCALLADAVPAAVPLFESLSSTDIAATINLAWSYWQLDAPDEALATLERARRTRFRQPQLQSLLLAAQAQLYALRFDYDAAVAAVDEALAAYRRVAYADYQPRFLAQLLTLRGQMVLLLYEWDAVLADYDAALAVAPAYAPTYFQRGVLFYTMGQAEQALADFQRYLTLAPSGLWARPARDYVQRIETARAAMNP